MRPIRDLELLVPVFRERVESLLDTLRASGHQPMVWETYRKADRARFLRKKGTSRNGDRSLHRIGCAVDFVCLRHMWNCHKAKCKFFEALGAHAKSQGLTWGGDCFPRLVDKPHVQVCGFYAQRRLRNANDIEYWVSEYLKRRPPSGRFKPNSD